MTMTHLLVLCCLATAATPSSAADPITTPSQCLGATYKGGKTCHVTCLENAACEDNILSGISDSISRLIIVCKIAGSCTNLELPLTRKGLDVFLLCLQPEACARVTNVENQFCAVGGACETAKDKNQIAVVGNRGVNQNKTTAREIVFDNDVRLDSSSGVVMCNGGWSVSCDSPQTPFKTTLDAPFEYIDNYKLKSAKPANEEALTECQKECLSTFKCVGVLFDQDANNDKCHLVLSTDTTAGGRKGRFYRLAALACEIKKYNFTNSNASNLWLDVLGANSKEDCRSCGDLKCTAKQTCADLNWKTIPGLHGTAHTCYSGKLGQDSAFGAYNARATWETARSYCASLGARLCSAADLASVLPEANDMWSSDACYHGHKVAGSSGGQSTCETDETAHFYGRCCADMGVTNEQCSNDPPNGFFFPFKDNCNQTAPCYNANPGRYYTGPSLTGQSNCPSEQCPSQDLTGSVWELSEPSDTVAGCRPTSCGDVSQGSYFDEKNSCHQSLCPQPTTRAVAGKWYMKGTPKDRCPTGSCDQIKVGTKFVVGWASDPKNCPIEACGAASVGKYYTSARTTFDQCEETNCTNAPKGHFYLGGGTQNKCPFAPCTANLVNAGSCDSIPTSTARDGCNNQPDVGYYFTTLKLCDTEMCPPMAGFYYFSSAQDKAGCAVVRSVCNNAKPGQKYVEPSTPVVSAMCPVKNCSKPAGIGEYYVIGGSCSQENVKQCTPSIGKNFTTNGRGTGKPSGCLSEACSIRPGFFFKIGHRSWAFQPDYADEGCAIQNCPAIPGHTFTVNGSCTGVRRCTNAGPREYYNVLNNEPCATAKCDDGVNAPERTWFYIKGHATRSDQCLRRECSESDPPQGVPSCFEEAGNCNECTNVPTTPTQGIPDDDATTDGGKSENEDLGVIIMAVAGVVAGVAVVAVVVVAMICVMKSRDKAKKFDGAQSPDGYVDRGNKAATIAHEAKRMIKQHDYLLNPAEVVRGKKLAQGAGGQIFLGTFGRQSVALKESYDVLMNDEHDEIVREASMMTKLRHHNIVQFFGIWQPADESRVFLVMELCSNGDLQAAALDLDNSLPARKKWMLQVASAMKYLHTRSPAVIHRDLKPQNVLLDSHRDAKVCDFGLSKTAEKTRDMTVGVGTVAYMPPEVMGMFGNGDQPAQVQLDGTKCDVFSFAIMALYVMTGVSPHDQLSNQQICIKVSMSGQRTEIPAGFVSNQDDGDEDSYADFVALVKRMWTQDPTERPDFNVIRKELCTIFSSENI